MFFSLAELVDIIVMTLAIGFIFKDVFRYTPKVEVLTPEYYLSKKPTFTWNDFWFAAAIVAPSIIFHEFGHKFSAMAFGMSATFQAAYFWLALALILKIVGFGFIFIVPAFTSIAGSGTALQMAAVSFAGPGINLVLWLVSALILKIKPEKKMSRQLYHFLFLIKKINMFLFIFNMLPIPGFDGWSVYGSLIKAIF